MFNVLIATPQEFVADKVIVFKPSTNCRFAEKFEFAKLKDLPKPFCVNEIFDGKLIPATTAAKAKFGFVTVWVVFWIPVNWIVGGTQLS